MSQSSQGLEQSLVLSNLGFRALAADIGKRAALPLLTGLVFSLLELELILGPSDPNGGGRAWWAVQK